MAEVTTTCTLKDSVDIFDVHVHLLMLLMQNICNVVLHCSELVIDEVQELIQVCLIKLTALHQNLQENPGRHKSGITSTVDK